MLPHSSYQKPIVNLTQYPAFQDRCCPNHASVQACLRRDFSVFNQNGFSYLHESWMYVFSQTKNGYSPSYQRHRLFLLNETFLEIAVGVN